MNNAPFKIADTTVNPAEKKLIELPTASLYTQAPISMPLFVVNGKNKGPTIFVFAAIHGDEINGVEIIRRLVNLSVLKNMHGTLLAIPVVNVYGFMVLSRYFPDRRDLNRAFPGSKTGSLTARVARFLIDEIIGRCSHGIDLHTGNMHLENLPHVRINTDVQGSLAMAKAFNVPVILDTKLPDGSLRAIAKDLDIPILVYEGGEALRFNEIAIRIGLRGVINIMRSLGMLPRLKLDKKTKLYKSKVARGSTWLRAPNSGIFHPLRQLGSDVVKGEKIGYIGDPFSRKEQEIFATTKGIIISKNTLPLVNEGDPLFHIAKFKYVDSVTEDIQELRHDFTFL